MHHRKVLAGVEKRKGVDQHCGDAMFADKYALGLPRGQLLRRIRIGRTYAWDKAGMRERTQNEVQKGIALIYGRRGKR